MARTDTEGRLMGAERDIEIALCVFREANDALVIFDPRDRKVVDLNPTALRLTGFERKAALSLKISDLLSASDPNDFRRLLAACQQTGFFHSQEGFFLSRKDGPPIPVNVSVSRIHTAPEPLGLAIIRDITERKKAEAELRQARDDLESRVRERTAELAEANQAMRAEIAERLRVEAELRQAKDAAESAGRVKDRFLAVLSHELRTPLTPVLAVVSALLDGQEVSPALRPTLEMIRRSISLEARLIDDLLDVMQAGQGRLRLNPEPVDAHALIEQAIEFCRGEAVDAGVRIVVDPKARQHLVKADPTRFQQVVWNLLQNAVKCTDQGGTIVVSTSDAEGDRLVVTVADDGRGIEPDLLPVIFEPFEQGQTSLSRRVGGLGLGLSISRSIVEGHGGRLTASSEGAGRGSTFTFDLPVARAPAPARGLDQPVLIDFQRAGPRRPEHPAGGGQQGCPPLPQGDPRDERPPGLDGARPGQGPGADRPAVRHPHQRHRAARRLGPRPDEGTPRAGPRHRDQRLRGARRRPDEPGRRLRQAPDQAARVEANRGGDSRSARRLPSRAALDVSGLIGSSADGPRRRAIRPIRIVVHRRLIPNRPDLSILVGWASPTDLLAGPEVPAGGAHPTTGQQSAGFRLRASQAASRRP